MYARKETFTRSKRAFCSFCRISSNCGYCSNAYPM